MAGLRLRHVTESSVPQAVAAVLISLVLIRTSLRLVKRNPDFLLGQPIPAADRERVQTFLLTYTGVTGVRELLVTYIGPEQVWLLARISIAATLKGDDVMELVRGIEEGMEHQSPYIYRVDVVAIGDE